MKDISEARNLTLLMDFYELTMARGYFDSGYQTKWRFRHVFPQDTG